MNSATPSQKPQELELKLTLPYTDQDDLVKLLSKSAPLARRKSTTQRLLSVYYDTPEQHLRKKRIALRVRQVDSSSGPIWIQTLKTGGASGSALSLRGEWEQQVQNSDLSSTALEATPWHEIDPDGTIFQALVPCFSTRFDRTSWLIRTKDHSLVEVALDIGQIESDHQVAPICELELELKAGSGISLFDLGLNIASRVAVLPASLSKAERGYMLAAGTLDMPVRSSPPQLSTKQTLVEAAQKIFRESFSQFTKNLEMAMLTDNPEVVHQARVGWRRFKSALRLFKPVLAWEHLPDMSALRTLLDALSHLRDLDVALTETLPSTVLDYVSLDSNRQRHWDNFERSLTTAAQAQRTVIRKNMQSPAMGVALLSITRYIESMTTSATVVTGSKVRSLESWTVRRLSKLKDKLQQSIKRLPDTNEQHLARIHAKRLRYGLESMQTVLPKHRAKQWLKKAAAMQGSMGLRRDFQRLVQLVAEFDAKPSLVEFLRGYATGLNHQDRT